MNLSAILLARTVGFIETADLNPRGKVFFPEIVPEIVNRYHFQKFPRTFEEFDESKGIEFHAGKSGDTVIQKVAVFNTLLFVETCSNTSVSKQILEEMLTWCSEAFDLNYRSGMIKQFGYVSDLTFYSDLPILGVDHAIKRLSELTSNAVSEIWREKVIYEPNNISISYDPLSRKNPIAPFSIARRAEAPYSENKYFSEAPLPTDLHISLLKEFEADIKKAIGKSNT